MRRVDCLCLSVLMCAVFPSPQIFAQIVSDKSFLTETSTPDGLNFVVREGTKVGENLFHGFREFSIPQGGSARIEGLEGIGSIFLLVTSASSSRLDGLLKAEGSANLFFVNPNGVTFGRQSSLDLGASFFATTARSLRFEDGLFVVSNPSSVGSSLSSKRLVGLGFEGRFASSIKVEGSGQFLSLFSPGSSPSLAHPKGLAVQIRSWRCCRVKRSH